MTLGGANTSATSRWSRHRVVNARQNNVLLIQVKTRLRFSGVIKSYREKYDNVLYGHSSCRLKVYE